MASPKNQPEPLSTSASQTPGTVITPGGSAQPPTPLDSAIPTQPPIATVSSEAESAAVTTEPVTNGTTNQDDQSVSWTASEFVAHDKSAGWYLLLAIGSLLLAAFIFFLTRDVISVAVVLVASCLLGIYGSHQPRQLAYEINQQGLKIGPKRYPYEGFKSFAVVPEGALSSLVFMPLRRFAVPVTVYYASEDEDKILSFVSDQLPFEEHRLDAIDRLLRRIRF